MQELERYYGSQVTRLNEQVGSLDSVLAHRNHEVELMRKEIEEQGKMRAGL
jgi:hypothetical protein